MSKTIEKIARNVAYANLTYRQARYYFDCIYITSAIIRCDGNITEAADLLGIERGTMYRLLRDRNGEISETIGRRVRGPKREIPDTDVPSVVAERKGGGISD